MYEYALQVAEILKDRPSWFRDCRSIDVLSVIPTANAGTIELIYMQVFMDTYDRMDHFVIMFSYVECPDISPFFFVFLCFGVPVQTYAPTTLAAARDFWTLRYTTSLEDGSLVVIRFVIPFSTFPSVFAALNWKMKVSPFLEDSVIILGNMVSAFASRT